MDFVPLYYGERLHTVNPGGDVGIVTLWSKVEVVVEILKQLGIDLSPENSRISVVANLYGNGLPHMLRNLLYNPQVKYLVVCGKDLSGSKSWLVNFFENGLEEVSFLGNPAFRIAGTERVIDGLVLPEHFSVLPKCTVLGEISSGETKDGFVRFFSTLEAKSLLFEVRNDPPPVPEPTVTRFPSNPLGHLIMRETPMEAWRELVFRLYRFGHRNTVQKSSGPEQRIELLNVHVVVENPSEESEDVLQTTGFSLDKFRDYGRRILDPVKPADLDYTYGWLLRTGMAEEPVDSVRIIAERLRKDPDTRNAYATLWDNRHHVVQGKHSPCLATIFFRRFEERLTMTATFRAHNAMDAWPENFYGLAAIQRQVSQVSGIPVGPITIVSHSISIDPSALEKAKRIAQDKVTDEVLDLSTGKLGPRFDPNGAFTVTIDKSSWELVVEHSFQGMKLVEYRGRTVEEIEKQLSRDNAISIISHALYIGRELARKEDEMKRLKTK